MPADGDIGKGPQIPTNLRLLVLLEHVASVGRPITPSVLADALGLPKPTVHRLLVTAEEEGFLQRHLDGRSYGPGRRLRKLASGALSSENVRSERLRIMTSLAEAVGETCNLAAPGRDGMVYLDRVETHWPLRIQLPIGTQVPFHCTASGKMYLSSLRSDRMERVLKWLSLDPITEASHRSADALLADLSQVRKRGYSTDNEEFMKGMVAVAVPILDGHDRLLSTLSIHAPVQRQSVSSLEKHLPRIIEATRELAQLA